MNSYIEHLDRITDRAEQYVALLMKWLLINSQTYHRAGMDEMLVHLEDAFSSLDGQMTAHDLGTRHTNGPGGKKVARELGKALKITKRPDHPFRIFLCGHMDTVLAPVDRSESDARRGDGRIRGTGATDAKGGLVVMLAALECFERSPLADKMGWEVLIVPDEEIGSHGSKPLLEDAAVRYPLGLLFEPAQPDGALVGERVGSGTYSAIVRGRAAHAGRHIDIGRNAIDALADFIVALRALKSENPGIRINVGAVEGGGPVNVVPAFARCRFNIRVRTFDDFEKARKGIDDIAGKIGQRDGISVEMTGGFGRPPKPMTPEIHYLLQQLAACGRDLGMEIRWKPSSGVCDGNILLSAGMQNVDSLGPVGDGLHTPEEFVIEESIIERARLVSLFLMKLSSRKILWPPKGK
ncbi:MAG: hydrolase [Deltaproteobacteria bacterium]|nr:hydrolase [Deltaproteobacteria bacterium]